MSNKILLLEDDTLLGETLLDLLEEDEHSVTYCKSGQEALYLLDINVPLISGVELLRSLRGADDKTPAIFLTSHKEKEMIREGFLSGADDYVQKPFDSYELLLRIRAILKRTQGDENECIGELCHDKKRKRIAYKSQELELSQKEYTLLALLMKNVNQVVTKEMIIEELWHSSEEISDGAIRVYINRLKHFLDDVMIENIRGVGYRLVLQF